MQNLTYEGLKPEALRLIEGSDKIVLSQMQLFTVSPPLRMEYCRNCVGREWNVSQYNVYGSPQ